jgi:beta-phosphoglucomutase
MGLQAAIFDMDGTMVDSMPFHAKAWRLFFESKGLNVSDVEIKEKGHGTLFDIMPRFFGEGLSREASYSLAMEKELLYRKLYEPHIKAIDGLEGFLQTLKARNIKIGLGTAADYSNTDFTIDTLALRHYFDTIVTSDLVPVGKPSPDVYIYAARALGVPPENCIVFEDTFSGIAAGKAAGMKVVAVTTMHSIEECKGVDADGIIADYHEVNLEHLMKLFES